jgi:hypothetical protein
MIMIGLDLSTKPGFAVFEDGDLKRYGTLWADKTRDEFGPYPYNYLGWAEHTVIRLFNEVIDREMLHQPGKPLLIVEETTGSNQNYTQKILEFIHYRLLQECRLREYRVVYIRDGVWKNMVGARQNKEEKRLQARISRQKKKKKEAFLKENPNAEKIPSFRAKLDLDKSGKAKVVAKLDQADYSIRAFFEHFGTQLSKEHEDAAEAALLVQAYFLGAPHCDGTIDGGIPVEKEESGKNSEADDKRSEAGGTEPSCVE